MALTLSSAIPTVRGVQKVWEGTVTFDASYPTGGESFTPANVGFVNFDRVEVHPTAGYVFEYDTSTEKIIAYWVDTTTDGAPMAEVANTEDLSAVVANVTVYGY
jgi:hypothetical protein